MKIIDLETEKGNKIITDLKHQGWHKTKEYSALAFDKGVDFDSYTLKNADQVLNFEWTNWFEWEITGTASALQALAQAYALKLQND